MKRNLLFLGPPGAGKGTQASLLSETNSYLHLSTGELLRKEVQLQTNLGIQVKEIINSGKLVNDELVLKIVKSNLTEKNEGWILDGFPRNLSQVKDLNNVLTELNQTLDLVFYFDVPEKTLIKRLLSRGRQDDNELIITTRLKIYKETTAPLIKHFKNQDILLYVDADRDLKTISDDIRKMVK